jgi:DNA gyrase subunit A
MSNNINKCQLKDEVNISYLYYAIYTNEHRYIPNAIDGFKPCQRRIIYCMYKSGLFHNKPFKKCASVAGDVMKYHPHGTEPIYETLVRMVQTFNARYPFLEGQGNFGSINGDNAAAMRYTETKLSHYSQLLTDDLDLDTVPMIPNYDDSEMEPTLLPVAAPILLLNGSTGIAVGMTTGIPSHNFSEILKGTIACLKNENITIQQLMEYITGPDFATGGVVINKNDLINIYTTGMGPIKIRGTYYKENDSIIIDSIPYKVNKATLLQQIMDTVKKHNVKGIEKIWDESNFKKIRIVIKYNQLCCPEFLIKILYKYTQLQSNFHCNFIALVGRKPVLMNLKDILMSFINGRMDVIRRRYNFLLKKTRKQQENTFAILVVLDNLEEIIKIIRSCSNKKSSLDALMNRTWQCQKIINYVNKDFLKYIDINNYKFTLEQCEYILSIRLQQLHLDEYEDIVKQMLKNYENINYYLSIIASDETVKNKIIEETQELLDKRWTSAERKTKIIQEDEGDTIYAPSEEVIILVDNNDYIKRMPLSSYKTQHRGGLGKNVLENDLKMAMITNTQDKVLMVTTREDNLCVAYPLLVYNINEFIGNKAKGQHINTIIGDDHKHQMKTIFNPNKKFDYLLFVTTKGTVRKNNIDEFQNVRKNGKQVMKITGEESIREILSINKDDLIVLASKKGNVIIFNEQDIRCFNSTYSMGVRAMKMKKDDKVIKAAVAQKGMMLLTITAMGYGKITDLEEYRIIKRGGSGVKLCKLQKDDEIIGAYLCYGDEELIIGTKNGNIFKTNCKEIRKMHKNTKGVSVCRVKDDDRVIFANIINNEIENNENINNNNIE